VHGRDFDELAELTNDWLPQSVHFYGTLGLKLSVSQLRKLVCGLLLGHGLVNHAHCVVFQLGACLMVSRPELNKGAHGFCLLLHHRPFLGLLTLIVVVNFFIVVYGSCVWLLDHLIFVAIERQVLSI